MPAQPLESIAGFAAHLRANGFKVGVAEQQAMLQAARLLHIERKDKVEAGWRSLVCGESDEWRRFPEIFAAYWYPQPDRVRTEARPRRDLRQLVTDLHSGMQAGALATILADADLAGDSAIDSTHAEGGASRNEPREQRPFSAWLPEDRDRLERIVEALARRMHARLMRRRRLDAQGRALDMRRTLRRSLRTGGIPFEPAWLVRRQERPRLFILVDVSRSMELHARLFLRIAGAFAAVLRARVFVFHTRLAEVTALLRRPSAEMMEKIAVVTAGFAGGTRIATSLREFVRVHAPHALGRTNLVLVMSDGFDADEPGELKAALETIRNRGARIHWLHPGREVPQSSALADCTGLVHAFAPVHDLDSLARLEGLIH